MKTLLPWFALPTPTSVKNVAVIGGGIAGCACAYQLTQAGYRVELFEQRAEIATEASGNPVGLLEPYLTVNNNLVDQFHTAGFWVTREIVMRLQKQGLPLWHQLEGIAHIACTDARRQRFSDMLQKRQLSTELVQWLEPPALSDRLGVACQYPGLWLPMAGMLKPRNFCQALLKANAAHIKVHVNTEIIQLQRSENQWQLTDTRQNEYVASHVVIANAEAARKFSQCQHFPMNTVPGQLTLVAATSKSTLLKVPACYEGYVTPVIDGQHVLGATYRNGHKTLEVLTKDHDANLQVLARALPEYAIELEQPSKQGRVAVRTLSSDHLPLVGPVGDFIEFNKAYQRLRHGVPVSRGRYPLAEYLPNLYVCMGLGSRGLSSSLLSAEVLTCLMGGHALPVSLPVYQALHPSRFWARAFKK